MIAYRNLPVQHCLMHTRASMKCGHCAVVGHVCTPLARPFRDLHERVIAEAAISGSFSVSGPALASFTSHPRLKDPPPC